MLGDNGGGFFNANAAHPFENPNPISERALVLAGPDDPVRVPVDVREDDRVDAAGHGRAHVDGGAVPGRLLIVVPFEANGNNKYPAGVSQAATCDARRRQPRRQGHPARRRRLDDGRGLDHRDVDGHDQLGARELHADRRRGPALHILLGEVSPGGTGTGLFGKLILGMSSVFIAGLMVGRTPEYLGKKIQSVEMKLVALYSSRARCSCSCSRASRSR